MESKTDTIKISASHKIEEKNVIPDFHAPDNLRLGFAPLYISFAEVWEGFDRIKRVMEEKRYEKYPKKKIISDLKYKRELCQQIWKEMF